MHLQGIFWSFALSLFQRFHSFKWESNWQVWCSFFFYLCSYYCLDCALNVLSYLFYMVSNLNPYQDFSHDLEFLLCEKSETWVSKVKNPALVSLTEDVLTCHSDVIYNWWSFQPHQWIVFWGKDYSISGKTGWQRQWRRLDACKSQGTINGINKGNMQMKVKLTGFSESVQTHHHICVVEKTIYVHENASIKILSSAFTLLAMLTRICFYMYLQGI